MQLSLPPFRRQWVGIACLGLGGSLAIASLVAPTFAPQPYAYPFPTQTTTTSTQDLRREVAFYQQRIQLRPTEGLDRAALAHTYFKLAKATGDTNWFLLAQQTAQASLQRLPYSNAGASLVLARVAEAQHNFPRAIDLARQVLATQPQQAEATSILVSAYLAQGHVAKAQATLTPLVQTNPNLATHLQQALVHAAGGWDPQAIQSFRRALAAEEAGEAGSSARLRTLFGQFYLERGQLDRAEQLFQAALRILPQYPPALLGTAELATRRKQYDLAQRHYAQVYAHPSLASVHDHLAIGGLATMYARQGQITQAQATWQRAEKLLRTHSDLHTFGHQRELAQILLARGQERDLPEALRLMEQESRGRRDAKTLETLAWALTRNGRHQQAQVVINEAIASGIRYAPLHQRAATIAQALGQGTVAQYHRRQALAIDPTLPSNS